MTTANGGEVVVELREGIACCLAETENTARRQVAGGYKSETEFALGAPRIRLVALARR
jgi:hypothetical protein